MPRRHGRIAHPRSLRAGGRRRRRLSRGAALLGAAILGACSTTAPTPAPSPTPAPTATSSPIPPTPTPTSAPTRTRTATPSPSPTSDPYAGLAIDDLAARSYGGGALRDEGLLGATAAFTRSLVSYDADGLTLYGFLNEPIGPGPHPVVLVLHGYVNPAGYQIQTYTSRYADALARAGFLAIHPNYRNHPPSDEGPNDFRVGYAEDVLHLAQIVRERAGEPGILARADGESIALWGHSMGGGIALRAATVDDALDGVVLYGSTSAEDLLNYERWGDPGRSPELGTAQADLERISPVYHLDRIEAPLSVHHGTLDADVPIAWSEDLCARMTALEARIDCHWYEGQGHIFGGQDDALFLERTVTFLEEVFAAR